MRSSILFGALLVAACSSAPPSLMLVIDAEASVRARTTRIELDVRGAEGSQVFGQSYDLTMRGWPIRKSFVPRNGDLSRFIVATVSAFEAGSTTPLLVSRIRSGFANGQNEVRVLLLDGCIGQPCAGGNTCVVENGSPRCVPTPEVVPVRDAAVVGASAVDTNTSDASTTNDGCMPACMGRTCGIESTCNTICGSCDAPQTCNAAGRCETVSSNGPRFIDPPTIAEPQPIAAGTAFTVSVTVTDPQGLSTIAAGEVRNPSGVAGAPGRYASMTAPAGSGQYTATVPWSAFSASNGGVPEDVSGTTTRVLRIRFVDQDGNELVQDISVRLGGCAEALCGGQCAACQGSGVDRVCSGTACLTTACTDGNHLCSGQCLSNTSVNSCGTSCTPCTRANATATCDGATCAFTCNLGYRESDAACVPYAWQQINTANAPTARGSHAMVYDSQNQRIILFGGDDAINHLNDTWAFNGTSWTRINTANAPSARYGHAMVYDSQNQRIILFGGNGSRLFNDIWAFNGNNWAQINTANAPSARYGHAMVYDSQNQRIVLFGGDSIGRLNDTWSFNGTSWTQINTVDAPPAREGHAMVYDNQNRRIVLFGGSTGFTLLNDTWAFNGSNWQRIMTTSTPAAPFGRTMVYDSQNQRTFLLCSEGDGVPLYPSRSWILTGDNWSPVNTANAPNSRSGHAMVYNSQNRRVVLFGGYINRSAQNETWELRL